MWILWVDYRTSHYFSLLAQPYLNEITVYLYEMFWEYECFCSYQEIFIINEQLTKMKQKLKYYVGLLETI